MRAHVARLERADPALREQEWHPFGHAGVDAALPGGGLMLGALHEVAGTGPDMEHAAAAALFVAGCLARLPGTVLWVLERSDLFAPGLAAVGLHPARVLYAEAGKAATVLLVMEEGLREAGLAGVVGEVSGRLTLTASRRLQLAAERSGVTAFAIRRPRRHDDSTLLEPCAAVTRWQVASLPSGPPLPAAPDVPGLARARWRLELVRCRGGEAASWVVEACDAQGRLGVVPDLADRQAAPGPRRASA
ncbi:ImuA family protein [Pararoseomonas baculiformis]|nr:damage-inducible mutagenesis protein [Pararoseomonas baculiformis]